MTLDVMRMGNVVEGFEFQRWKITFKTWGFQDLNTAF